MPKELLFSVTASDCDWSYTKGTGAGGQKRNKTSSAVHCIHKLSGASGYSEASRSQLENKRDAFQKMANSEKFKKWHKIETWRRLGVLEQIEREVEKQSHPSLLKLEIREEDKWIEIPFETELEIA